MSEVLGRLSQASASHTQADGTQDAGAIIQVSGTPTRRSPARPPPPERGCLSPRGNIPTLNPFAPSPLARAFERAEPAPEESLVTQTSITAPEPRPPPQDAALSEADVEALAATPAPAWQAAAAARRLPDMRACLVAHMYHGSPEQCALAARAYLAALACRAAPAVMLFDVVATEGVLRLVRMAAAARGAGAERDPRDAFAGDMDADAGAPAPVPDADVARLLSGLAGALPRVSLGRAGELLRSVVDGVLAAALAFASAPAVVVPAFACLEALLDPRGHPGDAEAALTTVFRALSAAILAPGPATGAVRGAAVDLARSSAASSARAGRAAASLVRHVCLQCPDRADARAHAVDATCRLLPALPWGERQRVVLFLAKLSRARAPSHRVVSVDLAHRFLVDFEGAFEAPPPAGAEGPAAGRTPLTPGAAPRTPAPAAGGTPAPQTSPATSMKRALTTPCDVLSPAPGAATPAAPAAEPLPLGVICLAVLLQRCSDKAAPVRARAASQLAAVLGDMAASLDPEECAAALARLGTLTGGGGGGPAGLPSALRTGGSGLLTRPATDGAAAPGDQAAAALRTLASVRSLARRRAADDRGTVRRAAVALLQSALATGLAVGEAHAGADPVDLHPTTEDLRAVQAAAGDVLLTVRRAALSASLELARTFVPRGAARCAAALVRVLARLVGDSEGSVQDAAVDAVSELVLRARAGPGAGEVSAAVLAAVGRGGAEGATLVRKALGVLRGRGQLKAGAVAKAMHALVDEASPLADDADAAAGAWTVLGEVGATDAAALSWPGVRAAWARCSPGREGPLPALVLRALACCAARAPAAETGRLVDELAGGLAGLGLPAGLAAAHVAALAALSPGSGRAAPGWAGRVFAAAEAAVRGLMDAIKRGDRPGVERAGAAADAALFAVGEVALVGAAAVPSRLSVLAQGLAGRSVVGASGEVAGEVPERTQAYAWVCVGKMALRDEALAKRVVPLLVQELSRSPSAAVRNNVMVVLTDLCSRYTALVDSHVPRLVACIRDASEVVRRQALALMARLLLSDYIKTRGAMFHQLLLALVDPSPAVRALAEYLVRDTLAVRLPMLAYNHFLEALFLVNNARALLDDHDISLSQAGAGGAARGAFDGLPEDAGMAGPAPEARRRRRQLYGVLLSCMAPENKFQVAAKVVQQVLSRVAEGDLAVDAASEEVVGDCLFVLGCPEARAAPAPGGAADRAVDDADPVSLTQAAGHVKGRLVDEMLKRHVRDTVSPPPPRSPELPRLAAAPPPCLPTASPPRLPATRPPRRWCPCCPG